MAVRVEESVRSSERVRERRTAALVSAGRRESLVARAGFGAIAFHLLDDAFLQPEPGTSAGDHLVATVPIAIALALAVVYPRLRVGLRGPIAIGVGLLAFVAGLAVPARHVVLDGASGDDFTGLLALLGGLVLAGLGTSVLWRSRRLEGSRTRRYLRRFLIALAGLVVALELVAPVGIGFVATHKARSPVTPVDLGRPHEEVSFQTADGLTLAGWYVSSQNGAAVIAFPGRSGPVDHARMLVRHGYGVLLFDRRGEGDSEGDFNAFGWGGDEDLLAALAFLRQRPDVDPDRIGGLGLSVGGELLLQTAAETDDLKAIVADGAGYRSIREQLAAPGAGKWLLLPNYGVTTGATAVFANEGPPPSLDELVGRIAPRSIFLVYADPGAGGEERLNPVYVDAAGEPKTVWRIPGVGHTGGLDARPREYEARVITFFERTLLGRP